MFSSRRVKKSRSAELNETMTKPATTVIASASWLEMLIPTFVAKAAVSSKRFRYISAKFDLITMKKTRFTVTSVEKKM